MKYLKWGVFAIFVVFILAQFFQPDRNQEDPDLPSDLLLHMAPEDSIRTILVKSCYDCHSNQTRYPWYARIVPVAQMINRHVRNGKQELNFSLWGTYTKQQQVGYLVEICEVIENNEMPLKSYLILHRDAHLDDLQKAHICNWSDEESMRLLITR